MHIDIPMLVEWAGYPGLFTVIFLESGVFFGFFLPGASLLFIAGVFAAAQVLSLWVLLPLLITAAILGDLVGYVIGFKLGNALYNMRDSRWFKKQYLDEAQRFFEIHGPLAVFLARFTPIVRTFTPIVAGAARMHFWTFFRWNALGGIIWTSGFLLFGYLLGNSIPAAERYLMPISLAIVFVTLIPIALRWKSIRSSMTHIPKAIVFDLDNTLSKRTTPMPREMGERIAKLLEHVPVAIMTDAGFERIRSDVLPFLPNNAKIDRLYLFPDATACCYAYTNGTWEALYRRAFTEKERKEIIAAMQEGITTTKVMEGIATQGTHIVENEGQIIFTALGFDATSQEKEDWDPLGEKRRALNTFLTERLPNYSVRIGGRTSVNVFPRNLNKAYGVEQYAKLLHLQASDMLFIGDEFFQGGNDAAVIPTGIRTKPVANPEETTGVIDALLERFNQT